MKLSNVRISSHIISYMYSAIRFLIFKRFDRHNEVIGLSYYS